MPQMSLIHGGWLYENHIRNENLPIGNIDSINNAATCKNEGFHTGSFSESLVLSMALARQSPSIMMDYIRHDDGSNERESLR